jgi:hypothetical protein
MSGSYQTRRWGEQDSKPSVPGTVQRATRGIFSVLRAYARETEKIQFGLDPATRNRVRNKRQLRLGEQGLIALGDTGPSGGLGGMKTAR